MPGIKGGQGEPLHHLDEREGVPIPTNPLLHFMEPRHEQTAFAQKRVVQNELVGKGDHLPDDLILTIHQRHSLSASLKTFRIARHNSFQRDAPLAQQAQALLKEWYLLQEPHLIVTLP